MVCDCADKSLCCDAKHYKIVRFYYDGRKKRTIKTGLTLEQAQIHCADPETRKEGVWFDGYQHK
jgi:hypothetical protein